MANTLKFGNGEWYGKKDTILAYNDENSNYKPLPFDFSRASKATVVNKDGLIEEVGSGQPRIDYKDDSKGALLLEPSRSNVITYSEDFSNAIWTNTLAAISVNPTADLSPDGTLTGNEFNEGTSSGRRAIFEDLSVTANQINTLSVFVKKGTSNYLRLVIAENGDASDWTAVQVNLSNNSLSTNDGSNNSFTDISSSISSVDYNGYYRLQISAKHPTATSLRLLFCTSNGVAIAPSNSYARPDYTGTNKTVFVWGCQLETNSSYATSYIPTSGSAVTRLVDSCTNGGAGTNIFSNTSAVWFIDFSRFVYDSSIRTKAMTLENSSGVEQIRFHFDQPAKTVRFRDALNSYSTIGGYISTLDNTRKKVALKIDGTTLSAFSDGVKIGSDYTRPNGFDIDTMDLYWGGANIFDIKFYNTALTDVELIALTS
jgi:hypothetical protein